MVTIEIEGATTKTLTEDAIFRLSPVRTHTGVGDFKATVAYDRGLETNVAKQDRIHFKEGTSTEFTGFLTDISHSPHQGQTTIEGMGIAKRLQETRPDYDTLGGSLTYTNISVQEALRDYWPRTPFDTHTVVDQNLETVATDEQVQEANTDTEWQNITTLADSDPWVIANGELQQAQTARFAEGETGGQNAPSDGSNAQPDNWSDGAAAWIIDSGTSPASYTFSLDHDIPEGNVGVAVRQSAGLDGAPEVDVSLDGTLIDTYPQGFGLTGVDWDDRAQDPYDLNLGYEGSLSAGSHTIDFEFVAGNGSTEVLYIDCVVLYDTRYTDYTNWDNTLDANGGYLDDPPLYPFDESVELDGQQVGFNVPEATVNSTFNDTSGPQAIAISNDGGANYQEATNTSSTTQTFSDAGREPRVRFTMDAFGSRTGQTPKENFNGQTVTDYELLVDGNNLAVIDELTLSRNHFENLQELHEYGDFLWAIDHDDGAIANMQVTSFRRGEVTRSMPGNLWEIDEQPEIKAKQYYNSIYLQGSLVNGNRPSAEVTDQDEINDVGEEISPGVLRDPSIVTEAGAAFRARSLLERAVRNNELSGTKTFPPTGMSTPGFARSVDFGDGGVERTLEEVSLSLGQNQAESTFDFVPRNDLSREIQELRRNSRKQSDQI